MRRFQKLRASASYLIIAVLAATCFTRGVAQIISYGIIFLVWAIYAFILLLLPVLQRNKYRREVRRVMKKETNAALNEECNSKLIYLLLCHVNHRITGYLKSIYPDATWEWQTDKPDRIMADGGTGRIKLYNVEEYNFADVQFDTEANIECSFLKIVSFKQAAQTKVKDSQVGDTKSEVDPQVWFEQSGRVILKNLIADLSSRGHNTLTIQEDGSCIIEQGDKTLKVRHLDAFPERVYYPRLTKVLAGAGIAAKTVDSGLVINW